MAAPKPTYEELEKKIECLEGELQHCRSAKEERFLKIVTHMPVMVDAFDEKGNIIFWNLECERVTGYAADEIIDNPDALKLLYPDPDYRKEMMGLISKLGFDFQNQEWNVTCKNGTAKTVSFSNISEEVPISGWFSWAVGVDVTEVKRSREALRRYRDRLVNILESISDGFFSLDSDLRVTYFNRAAARLLQREPNEVLGRRLFNAFPQARGSIFETKYTEALRTRKPLSFETYFGVPPYENWYDVQVYPFERGITVFFRVITEIKRGREERERLERQLQHVRRLEAIGTLSAGIAHDFNNILFPIIGYSEMLMEDAPPESDTRESLQEIFNAANRAKDLIRQILTFSRQSEEEQKPIEIPNAVKEVLNLLRATLPITIEIRKKIDPECGKILASPTQIHQIVMNLCTNAYHSMQENGGRLTVSLTPYEMEPNDIPPYPEVTPGPYLKLTVTDTGVGMPPEIVERIFEPYFTTRREMGGNGLGLSVVHGIVKNLGGHIGVYSERERGTAFHVYLPVFTTAADENGRPGAAPQPLARGHERVLLVDDEPQTAKMLQQMLSRLGYPVTPKTDSLEALESFRNRPDDFDLVITDTTMPRMTGITLFKKMIEIRPDIPVIICTGYSDLISEEKAKKLGIKAFIAKPVVMRELSVQIREVLDGKGSSTEERSEP